MPGRDTDRLVGLVSAFTREAVLPWTDPGVSTLCLVVPGFRLLERLLAMITDRCFELGRKG